jgi:hypothetical protein
MKRNQKWNIPNRWKQQLKQFLQQHRLVRSVTIGWMAVLLFFYHLLIGRNRMQKERIAIFAMVCMFVMAVSFQYIYADSNLSKEVQQYMNDASGDSFTDTLAALPEDAAESLTGEEQTQEDWTENGELVNVFAQDANVPGTENGLGDESGDASGDAISLLNGQYMAEAEDSFIEETVLSEETDMPAEEEQQPEDVVSDDTIETASGDAAAMENTIMTATASGDAVSSDDTAEEGENVIDVVLPTTCHVWMTTDDGADVPVVRSAIENHSDFDVAVNVENMRFSVADRGLGVERNVNMVFEAVNNENEARQVRMSGTDRVQSDVMSILLKTPATQGDSGTEGAYDLVSDTDAYFRIYGTISTQMSKYWCEDDVQISVVFRFSKAE